MEMGAGSMKPTRPKMEASVSSSGCHFPGLAPPREWDN